jgi:hypothetical protein
MWLKFPMFQHIQKWISLITGKGNPHQSTVEEGSTSPTLENITELYQANVTQSEQSQCTCGHSAKRRNVTETTPSLQINEKHAEQHSPLQKRLRIDTETTALVASTETESILQKEFIPPSPTSTIATFDPLQVGDVFAEAELFNDLDIYIPTGITEVLPDEMEAAATDSLEVTNPFTNITNVVKTRPRTVHDMKKELFECGIWILHFWRISQPSTYRDFKSLVEESEMRDRAVLAIQLDRNVESHQILSLVGTQVTFDHVDKRLMLINDIAGDFQKLVDRSVHIDGPSYLMTVHCKVCAIGISCGSPLFMGFPEPTSFHPFKQPGWKSEKLGSEFLLKDYFNETTTYLQGTQTFSDWDKDVLIVHIWSLFCEKSVRLWMDYLNLPSICGYRYSHVAVHIDRAPEEPSSETLLEELAKFHVYDVSGICGVIDTDKRFKAFWYECGYLMVPSTMIIVKQKLVYVGSIHTCVPEAVPQLIQHLYDSVDNCE